MQPFCLEEEPPAESNQSESPEGKEPSRRGNSEPGQDLVQPESAKREVGPPPDRPETVSDHLDVVDRRLTVPPFLF